MRGGGRPRYLPTGHLVYGSGESIMAVAFDAERLETRGDPIQIAPQGAPNFAVSNEGTLIYVAGSSPRPAQVGMGGSSWSRDGARRPAR